MKIILGPPGTGKTMTLLSYVEDAVVSGVRPDEIGFLTFTRKAADEAKTRVNKMFTGDYNFPFFRTIHSLAFRQLGLNKSMVMQKEHYQELGDRLGVEISCYIDLEEGQLSPGTAYGDKLVFIENLARVKMISLEEEYNTGNYDVDWHELLRFSKALAKYKEAKMLTDFTDMLSLFKKQGVIPQLKVLLIDEAQDLSMLQWSAIQALIDRAERTYICGDDDQSIFRWAGAATDYFINLPGDVRVLDTSWRVPWKVQQVADEIIMQIETRRPKVWKPRDAMGTVDWHSELDTVPLESGNWLLLARNNYLLKRFEDHCMEQGFSFIGTKSSPLKAKSLQAIQLWEAMRQGGHITPEEEKKVLQYRTQKTMPKYPKIWHEELDRISPYEREYFIAARRRGEVLLREPRIRISTIHGAKGGQADNVLLLTDMAYTTYKEMQDNYDDEARVFYVGITRAKEALHIISPLTNLYFNI